MSDALDGDPIRVCVLLADEEYRATLTEWLASQHQYVLVDADPRSPGETAIDVCIFDIPAYYHNESTLAERKAAAMGYLPYLLLLTEDQGAALGSDVWDLDHDLWDVVDETVRMPLRTVELEGRLRALARRRSESIELARSRQHLSELQSLTETYREINQAIARAGTRTEIEDAAVSLLVENADLQFSWIGYVDDETDVVEPAAWAGAEDGYLSAVTITTDETDTGQGPTGRAVRNGELVVVQDVATAPEYDHWREAALARGYRSSATVPLIYEGTFYGVLKVYADEVDAFGEVDRRMLSDLSKTIPYAIDAVEARQEVVRFQEAVEHAGYGIYLTDDRWRIEYVNPAFEEMTGYDQATVAGQSAAVVHEDDESFATIREAAEAGTVWIDEVTCRRRSGERYTAHQTVAPIVDASEDVAGYVGVQMDVTEDRLRQQQLEVLYRVLRHNLRNDMTTLAGYADLLLEDAEDEATVDALEIIAEKARSLATMSEKAGEVRHTLESVHAAGRSTVSLGELVGDVRSTADLGAATVSVTLADADTVPVDQRLGSVLEELVENAQRHADRPDPAIRIEAERVDDDHPRVVVRVADDGPGIPDEERAVLAAGHETPLQHGSGFGLWAVHWTVECLGGTIDIESQDGRGTVVTVAIPLDAADAACPRVDRRSH